MAICVMAVVGAAPCQCFSPDFLDGSAFALSPAASCRDDERLAERMGVPRGSRTRFESDTCALHQRGVGRLKKRIDTYRAGEPLGRSFY